MKGKAYVTNGKEKYPVKVTHWWPGREYVDRDGKVKQGVTELFATFFRGRRYATRASVRIPHTDWGVWYPGVAECRKKDNPSRKVGRELALSRLIQRVNTGESDTWELVEE